VHALLSRKRWLLPLLAAVACFVGGAYVPPLAAFVLTMCAFGFVLDAVTYMWSRASRTGSMHDYRQ
jgi:hypothetical protein